MKLSAYGYLFNARVREFDLDGMVKNFTDFFDETVIATLPLSSQEDDTLFRLEDWQLKLGEDRFRIVVCPSIDISKTNRWDGELKTVALQACSKSTFADPRCYVIMDGDERVPLSQRDKWIEVANQLNEVAGLDGLLIPVVDLIQDEYHAKPQMGYKFRMHKDTVVRRGVIPSAEYGNGLFDTSKSDSTEPLRGDGTLGYFTPVGGLYVLHYGHLDAERRARLNREFWREHWKNRDGKEPDMALDAEQIKDVPMVRHNLPLE